MSDPQNQGAGSTPGSQMGSPLASLLGAWKLFLRDERGMEHFEISEAAFWRSFQAAFYAAPLVFFITMVEINIIRDLEPTMLPVDITSPWFYAPEFVGYVLSWALFPLLMVQGAKLLGREGTYAQYIIAYNWATVVSFAIFAIPSALYSLGVFASSATLSLSVAFFLILAFYQYSVTKIALQVSGTIAILVVFANYTLMILLERFVTVLQSAAVTQGFAPAGG